MRPSCKPPEGAMEATLTIQALIILVLVAKFVFSN
jgi:hypothetical protein